MLKCIQISDFPRTKWRESVGLRKALTIAFNTARKDEKKLRSVQALLQFATTKVNRALLELETGKELASNNAIKGTQANIVITDDVPQVQIPVEQKTLEVPPLINVDGGQ